MKTTKYAIFNTASEYVLFYYNSKEEAEKRSLIFMNSGWKVEIRPVEIDLYCESCDKDLAEEDEYLKVDEHTRYCSDCYETESFTYYTVGGEEVSDENGSVIHEAGESLD